VWNTPSKIEFVRGVKALDTTRELPTYLVFVVKSFLDTHHLLRGRVYSPQETCQAHLALIDEDLVQHVRFHHEHYLHSTYSWATAAKETLQRASK
jgi:hypothetical protein